ncbi:MAG: single-stranded DNA-binding protein [Candidatus Heimdallarchaeota archaeon]
MDFSEEIEVKIGDLSTNSKRVNVSFKVINQGEPREVTSRDGSNHRVADTLAADETGSILISLWNDSIDQVEVGGTYKLSNGYVTVFRDSMRLSIGKYGHLEASDTPIEEVNEENALSDKFVERPYRYRGSCYGGSYSGGSDYRGRGRRDQRRTRRY